MSKHKSSVYLYYECSEMIDAVTIGFFPMLTNRENLSGKNVFSSEPIMIII